MRPVSDYLKKLLYQYDCLVVPALGGFLTHGVPATYHEATGQYLPPRRKVAFNEALRLDDGILLNYIILHENCSREEALRAIAQFVADLKRQTREQGSFTLDGIGMFSVNTENTLQFDPELRHNFQGNAYGFQPLLLTRQMVHPAVPMLEKPDVVRPLPAPVSSTALVPVESVEAGVGRVLPLETESRRYVPWHWAAAVALLTGTLGVVSYLSVVTPNQSSQSSLNPTRWLWSSVSVTAPSPEADNTTMRLVKAKPALVPVVLVKQGRKPEVTPTDSWADTKPVEVAAPVRKIPAPRVPKPAESVAPMVVKDQLKPATPPVPVQSKDPFTVIAGSFANRSNAIRFQKMLLAAGYEDAYILPGRTKGLIKVAAFGFETYEEAHSNLDSVNALTGITPWVMRSR
jgi:CCDC81-like prokaryotic HU domain 1/CCDC81-like prokaryotic HU domain 2/SPOR domain